MFQKYQATPEYRLVNEGMGLDEFKSIFWWEYFHRLLGRAIGFVFLAPLVWFAARRSIPAGLAPRLVGLFVIGGAQGAMGWYMVKSGLVHDPHVSALRLAAHLALALLLLGAMLWTALTLLHPTRDARSSAAAAVARWSAALSALVFVMALSGALVAGVRAGLVYNTFPLMNGYVVPPELLSLRPWYRNLFQNLATVQFDHRLIAWALIVLVPVFWWRVRAIAGVSSRARMAVNLLLAMLVVQVSLGIGTLLLVVPVGLAATHQAGAVLLLACALNATHALSAGSSGPRVPH
jgi:cytochrome c oxidase assembly protein subunit 15